MVPRSYRFRLDVSPEQSAKLHSYLDACHTLRNRLVADRLENRELCKEQKRLGNGDAHYLSRADQYKAVSQYAKGNPTWAKLHSQVSQNVACRVEEGYRRFFEALKTGKPNVHPPKRIDRKNYRSFTFPQYGSGAFLRHGKIYLSGLGEFQVRDHRKVRGLKKTLTIKWMHGHWWVIIVANAQEKDVIERLQPGDNRPDAGADPGISALLTSSHGEKYDPPRAFENARKSLAQAQRTMSRQFEARKKIHEQAVADARTAGVNPPALRDMPYSNRLKKQIYVVASLHAKVFNIRDYHHKKTASILADRYRRVAVEEHGLQFMIRNRKLAKAASDRAIGNQKLLLQSKLGSRYHKASNQRPGIGGNSQTCVCGEIVAKELKDRVHACPTCGLVADRDHVSANIVQLIAFGTISDTLSRDPGRISSDVENAKGASARAVALSRKVSARPMKRHSQVSRSRRSTTDGEPAVEGKTGVHPQHSTGVGA
jgi:transposase